MILGALSWPVILAIVGASSVLIVTLHLLRLRRKKIEVPHLALFEETLGSAAAAKRVDWLRRLLALLLSLLIAAAIALSLGEPELIESGDGIARVLIIDQSLSMEAIDAEGRSRRERALDEARRFIDAKARGEAIAIIAMDHVPITLSGLVKDRGALYAALERSTPGWGAAAYDEALELAHELLSDEPEAEIVLLSDTLPALNEDEEGGRKIRPILIADPAENLAIAELAARRLPSDPARVRTLIRIENHGPSERRARLNLSSPAGLVETVSLTLGPYESERLEFDDLPLTEGRIDAALIAEDDQLEALSRDDHASVSIAPRERLRVHLITEGNLYIEAALLLDASIELSKSLPSEPLPSAPIDLYVADGVTPELPSGAPAVLFLGPHDEFAAHFSRGRIISRPIIRSEREEDPLVRGVRLYETNIKDARALQLERGDRALARVGSDAIMALIERDDRRALVFGFRIEESDLPLRAAFPLILLRGIDELLGREVLYQAPLVQHQPIEIRSAADELSLSRPSADGEEVEPAILPVFDGRARFMPDAPGVYRVQGDGSTREIVVSRAALDESAVYREAREPAEASAQAEPDTRSPLALPFSLPFSLLTLLLIGGLTLLLVEGALYHLRWIE